MKNKLIIKRENNKELNILSVLKVLYMEGSQINSFEKIGVFRDLYRQNEVIEVVLNDSALNIFRNFFLDENISFEVKYSDN